MSKGSGVEGVRWEVAGASWQLGGGSPDEAVVRLTRDGETLAFAPAELAPLLASLRSLTRETKPAAAGRAWQLEDDAALELAFDAGEPIAALAHRFARTPGAITARLVKLGRVEDRGQRRWP